MNDIFNENVPLKTETPAFAKHVLPAVPSVVYNEDCVEGLKRFSDNHFDLAIVDPPYGINRLEMSWTAQSNSNNGKSQADSSKWASYEIKKWDNERPTKEYWNELKRVSKNQIVWGANYFPEFFTDNMGVVFWDKIRSIDVKFSHGELAFTTFGGFTRKFPYNPEKYNKERWHPTQKPIALYDYLLREFAKEGDLILDTHLGSGSSRIAAYKGGFDFVGFEIDQEYYEKQEKRFNDFKSQLRLF